MSKILKQVRCGRLVQAVVYTAACAGDSPRQRAQKQKASTAARERLNARTSYAKLKRKLAANFDDGDLLVSLSFDDEHLPQNRAQAQRKASYFLKRLRAARAARGQPLYYIYVVEGFCPGVRPNVHVVLNSTGADLEEIMAAWTYGDNVDIKDLTFDRNYTYEDLASYLTKEPREWGHPVVGERTWCGSLNLVCPEPETVNVPNNVTLAPPPEAFVLSNEGPIRNGWGEWAWLEYLLPYDPNRKRPKARRKRKKRKSKE